MAKVLCVAEDEAGQDLLLLNALQTQLEVLPGVGVVRLHIVAQQAQHLHCVLLRGQRSGYRGNLV